VRERPFVRGSDCPGVRSNLLPKSESDFQASGRVKWPQRTGPRARPGSLDRPGRGAHRTPTGGPNFAAVGEQESKYGNGGSKLAGGGPDFGEASVQTEHGRTNAPIACIHG
jgi:hypothetical protein